jgi:hypothetical protein
MPASESEQTSAPVDNNTPKTTTAMATNCESTNNRTSTPASPEAAATANGYGSDSGVPKTKFAVYCGASAGHRPEHLSMARELARAMHKHDIGLGTYSKHVSLVTEQKRTNQFV